MSTFCSAGEPELDIFGGILPTAKLCSQLFEHRSIVGCECDSVIMQYVFP